VDRGASRAPGGGVRSCSRRSRRGWRRLGRDLARGARGVAPRQRRAGRCGDALIRPVARDGTRQGPLRGLDDRDVEVGRAGLLQHRSESCENVLLLAGVGAMPPRSNRLSGGQPRSMSRAETTSFTHPCRRPPGTASWEPAACSGRRPRRRRRVTRSLRPVGRPVPPGLRPRRRPRRPRLGAGRPRPVHAHHPNHLIELDPCRINELPPETCLARDSSSPGMRTFRVIRALIGRRACRGGWTRVGRPRVGPTPDASISSRI
jgi:hypothetical protein